MSLLSVAPATPARNNAAELTIYIPTKAMEKLEKKVLAFRDENVASGKPKNADLVQSIGRLQIAGLRALWRGPATAYPADAAAVFDWEVWVAKDDADVFVAKAEEAAIHVGADQLEFPEQTILRVSATRADLAELIGKGPAVVTALAKPATTADFFDAMPVADQQNWSQNLSDRTTIVSTEDALAWVTVMDTGVTLANPLIAPALDGADRHAADPAWALDDAHGHGSGMAGLVLYGDLTTALETLDDIDVRHRLESVKVLPDAGANPHHLLGAVTRNGVNAVEAEADRRRVFMLATSTPDDHPHDGAPTSWSTELDQLAAGVSGAESQPRLLVVSAGNVATHLHMTANYHSVCDHADQEIESPGQAWNPLTVGAFTDKHVLSPGLAGAPLAPMGDLSPYSKTASWAGVWPLKPDIVLEGGNLVLSNFPPALQHQDVSLLTTANTAAPTFATTEATSAASALAARLAAQTWCAHPDLWPETIRALIVASARWTAPMTAHLPANPNKGHYEPLFQRYGYGLPYLTRATRSADDMVTLIVEDEITPYAHSTAAGGGVVHNEIKLHSLPWPVERLRALGAQEVTLRVTLSTFVEPNPREAARGRKLQYGSHGLRFKLKRADESNAQFEARINKAAAADDDAALAGNDQDGWRFGARRRDVGSVHRDEITCLASDLARRPVLAVHPVGGWWKSKMGRDDEPRVARYSLVMEIDAGGTDVDLYTEIQVVLAAQIAAQVVVDV